MKKSLTSLLTLILYTANTQAQPILTAATNIPAPGVSFSYAYKNGFTPSTAGAAQVWDFTVSPFPPASFTHSYLACSATPYCADYPGSNIASQDPNGGYTYYTATADSLTLTGNHTISGQVVKYSDPELILRLPMAYGDSFADSFQYYYPQTGGGAVYFLRGSDSTVADGWGTLKTPAGTFANTLRVTRTERYILSNTYNGPATGSYTDVYYTWYDTAHKDLLYQTYTSIPGAASPSSTSIYAKYAPAGSEVSGIQADAGVYNIYPNPCSDHLSISYSGTAAASATIQLFDIPGRLIGQWTLNCKTGTQEIDVRGLQSGIYLYRILEGSLSKAQGRLVKN